MKRACVIPVLCLVLAMEAGAGGLANPGFEGDFPAGGAAPAWRLWPIRGIAETRAAKTAAGRGGDGQMIEVVEKMDGWAQISTPIPGGVKRGCDYEARVWLRGDRALHDLAVCVHDNTDWFPGDVMTASENVGLDWTEVVLRFRANRTVTNAWLGIRLVQEGRLFIDDASFATWRRGEPAQRGGNLVRNGSFEAGLSGWYGHWCAPDVVRDATAPRGNCVAHIPGGAPGRHIGTALFRPDPGWPCTVSFWMRSSTAGTKAKVTLASGYHSAQNIAAEQTFTIGTNWQPFAFTCDVPPSPNGQYALMIEPGPARMWLDAVQIERGTATNRFAPRDPVEAGLEIGRADSVHRAGEDVRARLTIANHGPAATGLVLTARVKDVWERTVADWPVEVAATPGITVCAITVTPQRATGCFRLEVTAGEDLQQPHAEAIFTVLPAGLDFAGPASAFGTHVDYGDERIPAAAGARWTKSWLLDWSSAEPTPGRWTFARGDTLAAWRKAGLATLAVLSGPPRRLQNRPEKAADWGWYSPVDFSAMTEYARRTAGAYRDAVGAWELENEPNISIHAHTNTTTAAKEYAKQARALVEGVRAAGDRSPVVLGSITLTAHPAQWLAEVAAADPGLLDRCDAVSIHNYTADPAVIRREADRLRATLRALGREKPLWDTEWCPVETAESFCRDAQRAVALDHVSARRAAAMTVHGFVARAAYGFARSFLYACYGGGDVRGSAFGLWQELDNKPGPLFVAHAVLADQLRDAKFAREREEPGAWAYEFGKPDGSSLLVVWQRDTAANPVEITVATNATATDFMGNRIASDGKIRIGFEPVYIAVKPAAEARRPPDRGIPLCAHRAYQQDEQEEGRVMQASDGAGASPGAAANPAAACAVTPPPRSLQKDPSDERS